MILKDPSIFNKVRPEMMTVRQVLKNKGEQGGFVWSVTPDTTLQETLHLMAEKNIGAVIVIDQERVVGIFSERDFVRIASVEEALLFTSMVSRVMTRNVYTIAPDQTIDDCMLLMTQKHIRHLPVVEGEKLIGVISIGDVIKSVISEKDTTIRGLENFILGREYSG